MIPRDTEVLFSSWQTWFPGVNETNLRRYFARWQHLRERSEEIRRILAQTSLLSKTRKAHQLVAEKLNYELPYRLVVLGETGAGKSSLINALLSQDRLLTGSGGAITGVPIYVHPIPAGSEQYVLVVYRSDEEFFSLVRGLTSRFGLTVPDSKDEVFGSLVKSVSENPDLVEEQRTQLVNDLTDIVVTWQRVSTSRDSEISKRYDPENDKELLHQLMEEKSVLNAPGASTREIAAISRIEYFISTNHSGLDTAWHSNIVIVDTPGIGAVTLRHREILVQEVENADAVILVVDADRPEEKTRDIAAILSRSLLRDFSPEQKEHFAQKVFLVVNKIDVLKNDEKNLRRLEVSVQELCQVISPKFWAMHVGQSTDLRYFETIAELAVYANAAREGRLRDPNTVAQYRSYLLRQLSETELSTDTVDIVALERSAIPVLRSQLSEFLGERRLQLMLQEAQVRLDLVIATAIKERDDYFSQHKLDIDPSLSASMSEERLERELCRQRLVQDRKQLNDAYSHMWDQMQLWRVGDAYRESLKAAATTICSNLDHDIGQWLETELSNPERITQIRSAVGGFKGGITNSV